MQDSEEPREKSGPEITSPQEPTGMSANRKIQLGLAAALVVVALGMYGWKVAAVGAVEAQAAADRTQLLDQVRQHDQLRSEAALRHFSTPLAWAIRREVMAGNLDQVDQYFVDLVQMEGFQSAVLANPDGKITVASDRKWLAMDFSQLYPAQYLQASGIEIQPTPEGKLRAIIPIMGLSQRLGTLVLEFQPPPLGLE